MKRKTQVVTRKYLSYAWVSFVHSRVMFEAARRRGTFEEKISKKIKTDFIKLCNILLTSRYGLC